MCQAIQRVVLTSLLLAFGLSAAGCGGGETAIVGVGNSGNRFMIDGLTQVAEALAEHPGTPEVKDDTLAEIYGAILRMAKEGDPHAALIVYKLAEEQRRDKED